MRPAVLALLAATAFGGIPAGGARADDAARCTALLGETLAVMEDRAPMKDELATALMWLRLDAHDALMAGDPGTCLGHASAAAALLQLPGDD